MVTFYEKDTIVAVSTPPGTGGIAMVRLSGSEALEIADKVWYGKSLREVPSHTVHYGGIGPNPKDIVDHAVATVFHGPHSFTGEDTVEFAVHGSKYIQKTVVNMCASAGARVAYPGEFTQRAFQNGRMDLAQAEGVADLISASSRAAHRLAMSQMSGTFSQNLNSLRDRLIELASLLELELDFSEEDVEFADRTRLREIMQTTLNVIDRLVDSYESGRAYKEGFPVAIAGAPNVGKSTLLNFLLSEDKAIVSDIPGTTRDIIEDTCEINGVLFRFFDTAGLRDTDDSIEKIGISRARNVISHAAAVIWVVDPLLLDFDTLISDINESRKSNPRTRHIIALNKCDLPDREKALEADRIEHGLRQRTESEGQDIIQISAKTGTGIEELRDNLVTKVCGESGSDPDMIVTNERHKQLLESAGAALCRARQALEDGLSADLIAQDVREAIFHLGEITGHITTDHLLANIFSRFCIGK